MINTELMTRREVRCQMAGVEQALADVEALLKRWPTAPAEAVVECVRTTLIVLSFRGGTSD